MNDEKVIEMDYYIELVKCEICGNVVAQEDFIPLSMQINVSSQMLEVYIKNHDSRDDKYVCTECFNVFKEHVNTVEAALNARKGKYNFEITLKNLGAK